MVISFLASGSKANTSYIGVNGVNILIDVGLSMKQINNRLLIHHGIDLEDIDIVIITHAHSDHINSLDIIKRNHEHIKFVIPDDVRSDISEKKKWHIPANRLYQLPVRGETLRITSYKLNHDVNCHAYKIVDKINQESYVHISDNGGIKYYDDKIIEPLKGADYYAIESNHDLTMQILDQKRDAILKRRVLSFYGHTDNVTAMQTAFKLVTHRTKGIIWHHLSEDCNTEELATKVHDELLTIWGKRREFSKIVMKYARQDDVVVLSEEEG